MSQAIRVALFSIAFVAGLAPHDAGAAEAYLCDGGRIVNVPFGKLEEMKRSDPCIAAYYGLKVPAEAVPARPVPASIETGTLPASPTAAGAAPDRPAPSITSPQEADAAARPERKFQQRMVEKPSPPRATPGTDYRNVVLLNPQAGAPAIYRHER